MSSASTTMTAGAVRATRSAPTWWVVFLREAHELWVGGKAPVLLLVYTILLGILTYVMASNSELSLIPPQEMVYETLKGAFGFSLFILMVVGADSISGERERSTLESLLLTPTSRRQIMIGKFMACITPWPMTLLICIPYLKAISQGNEVFGHAVYWGIITSALLVPAFAGLGMLASFWSNSNKSSYFTALAIYVLFLVPTTLPGRAQTGVMGALLQQANPIAGTYHFQSKLLVNNRSFAEFWPWLVAPVVLSLIVYGFLFLYLGPGLRLEAGRASRFWDRIGKLIGVRGLLIASCAGLLAASPVRAQAPDAAPVQEMPTTPGGTAHGEIPVNPIRVDLDLHYVTVKQGDPVFYKSTLTNSGTEKSAPICVAMNIVNLNAAGDIVDPEDWSPQRTQYLDGIEPGATSSFAWRVNAILDGDYLVYMVVIPEPSGKDATSQVVASSGIHLTVNKFTKLNPAGILPYAIGGPVLLTIAIVYLYRRRRRELDTGATI
jgi:ABC-2 type transport system permease protein